jgi:radical SAM protein with 4Fe4S-binding SPASM domain
MIAEHTINNNKRTDAGEIIVTLFELCNLSCLFCNQDHTSMLGIDIVIDKIEQIKQAIAELQKNKNKKSFSVNIMGGEIFDDRLDDSVFNDYRLLVKLIKEYAISQSIDIEVRFVTNFIWKKHNRVRELVNDTNCWIGTSYDPAGRFNKETFEIFQNNVTEFTDRINSINVIMTKQNIDRFIKNQIPFFDYIYNHFDIYFDYYTPERNVNILLPTDVELRDFNIHILDNWPNCYPFKNYKLKQKNNMTCMDTYTIMPTGSYGKCDILLTSSLPKNVIPIKIVPVTKQELEEKWFSDYNCLECHHFERCSLGCFLSNHIKDARTQTDCWLKEVYDYVDSK